jgi:hypothetical protein
MFHSKRFPYQSVINDIPRYMQAFEENHSFLPDISIIDLLFNLGPDALKYLVNLKLTELARSNEQLGIQP